jgi:hypothetical protein
LRKILSISLVENKYFETWKTTFKEPQNADATHLIKATPRQVRVLGATETIVTPKSVYKKGDRSCQLGKHNMPHIVSEFMKEFWLITKK